jgi:predicted membrane protein
MEEQKQKMIEFATIKMTMWAFVVLLVGLITSLYCVIFVPSIGIYIGLLLLTATVVAAYNINCLFVGKCFLFAKALSIYYVIVSAVTLFTYIGIKSFGPLDQIVNSKVVKDVSAAAKVVSPIKVNNFNKKI